MGSSKYGAYVLFITAVGNALQRLSLLALQKASATGPYPLLFANLVGFALEVPPLQTFSVLGIDMSDKMFVYILGIQLLLAAGSRSITAGLCGLVVGLLYHLDLFGLQSLRVREERKIGRYQGFISFNIFF